MNSFIKRHQILLFSVVICFFSLHMALTAQKRGTGDVIVEKVVSILVSPFQAAFLSSYSFVHGSWTGYVYLVGLRDENKEQKLALELLMEENNKLKEAREENRRLKTFLAFTQEASLETVAAEVLAFNFSGWTKTVKLNKGASSEIAEDMPVVTATGVVGRIIESRKWTSTALLVTDPRSNIDILVQRTRTRGVAEGNGSDGLILKYVRNLDDVKVGDRVITAGYSGIYPKGLLVGEVTRVEKGEDNFFKFVEISPGADIQRLEEVLIGKAGAKEGAVPGGAK